MWGLGAARVPMCVLLLNLKVHAPTAAKPSKLARNLLRATNWSHSVNQSRRNFARRRLLLKLALPFAIPSVHARIRRPPRSMARKSSARKSTRKSAKMLSTRRTRFRISAQKSVAPVSIKSKFYQNYDAITP